VIPTAQFYRERLASKFALEQRGGREVFTLHLRKISLRNNNRLQ
jgi:hypothetical protein